jgi:outer membrane receptor for ferrienterochelin and colicin
MMKFLLLTFLSCLISLHICAQGITTGSITGTILNEKGETLPGATVVAVHVPSGTRYGSTTRDDGRFVIPNARVGSPYTITVTYIGHNDVKFENVAVSLGRAYELDARLSESATELAGVEVNAERDTYFNRERTGTSTNIQKEQIASLPTISRSLTDFTRLTPQATITSNGGISIAGANNRYNSVFIDGAVNNDVFGLSDTGTNGGQANSISPISIDAIEEFQVVLAPFDVRLGGFAGGGINAVTRSGSNNFSGSAYTFYRDEKLAGKTPTSVEGIERKKLDDFKAQTTGFRLGGPILKDKIFFFVNGEIQRDKTPQPFDFATYNGSVTQADLNSLTTFLGKEYGYDAGGYLNNAAQTKSNKLLAKLDFNISDVHKLTIRHSYTSGEAYKRVRSSSSQINFGNNGEFFPSTTNSTAVELKSTFGSRASNNLIVGFTRVVDDRGATGSPFPRVTIKDGSNNIIFGTEPFSTANLLKSSMLTLTDNFSLYKGKHTFTFGTHNEFSSFYNTFIGNNYGTYTFANLNSFLAKGNSTDYERSYSLVDNLSDGTKAAGEFKVLQLGFYGQDEFEVSKRLTLTGGIRFDVPMYIGRPKVDTYFNETTIAKIEAAGYNLEGAKVGSMPSVKVMLSPRIGFNYDATGDRSLQLRGGVGIFTSRIPYVWPGASYNNNGVLIGAIPGGANPQVPFRPNPFDQYTGPDVGATVAVPSGDINLFSKRFKFPKIFRMTFAVDKTLPWNMVGTLEGIFTKTMNNVIYYQYNINTPTQTLAGQDNRPRYNRSALVDPTYRHILLGDNTNKGYGYNFTAQLQKPFDHGFSGSIGYTFGRSKVLNEGTSSQNSSQWRNMENVNGKNRLDLSYSDFDLGSRIVAMFSYKKEYLNLFSTTISLFYNGQSGNRFSYIYSGSVSNDDPQSNSTASDLIYVPRAYTTYAEAEAAGEIRLIDIPVSTTDPTVKVSRDQQWANLNAFIEDDKYLSSRRGNYAERNGSRLPFVSVFDLRILQDVFVAFGSTRHSLQISFDVFNFTNLLNKNWGRQYFYTNDVFPIIQTVSVGGDNIPNLQFNKPTTKRNIDDSGTISSRWQGQLGLRYSF